VDIETLFQPAGGQAFALYLILIIEIFTTSKIKKYVFQREVSDIKEDELHFGPARDN
jgi:hypothetical protein